GGTGTARGEHRGGQRGFHELPRSWRQFLERSGTVRGFRRASSAGGRSALSPQGVLHQRCGEAGLGHDRRRRRRRSGLLNSMKPDQPEAVAPSMPEGWNDPLPELDFNRNQLSMDDYRNYGRKTGEHQFFDPNALPSSSPRVLGNLPPMSFEPPAEQL